MRALMYWGLAAAMTACPAAAIAAGYNPAGGSGPAGGGTPSFESAGPVSSGVPGPTTYQRPVGYRAEGFGASAAGGGSPGFAGPGDPNATGSGPRPVAPSAGGYKPDRASGPFGGGVER